MKPWEHDCRDDCHTHVSDFQSLSRDLSLIKIFVNIDTVELCEVFRGTNIGILKLDTAECASLASKSMHTLKKFTKLFLWGTYIGRCTLQLPATIHVISLQEVESSSEWLCSLLIELSSLEHPVECELWNVVLQQCADESISYSQSSMSELRSEILSRDMSEIAILVENGSVELFEIFRSTNIGILTLKTAECASLTSRIVFTLNKLAKLCLFGTYRERCTLHLPATLQCISMQEVECSAEWLCSLLVALWTLDHPVECELWNVVLQQCACELGDNSQARVSDFHSEILSIDFTQTTILLTNGSVELFKLFRGTNIGILTVNTADMYH
ncbi:hypothetical protein DPMN_161477 [Dreissena polymorpha]|uniref:Uncharacterized protein n=1 Tax=Dreissena polymorpha TaxID=45954 RepID=A0A9D4EQH5_DREPO|nr:hypothetical protein DPMN_161477 [Dreissena polymorpha]